MSGRLGRIFSPRRTPRHRRTRLGGARMEIRTTRKLADGDMPPEPPAAEKGRYLRRKAPQRLKRSPNIPRRLMALGPVAGKLAFMVAMGAFLFTVFNYAFTSDRFHLRAVKFVGARHLDTAKVEQTIRQSLPTNVLMINL